MQGKRILVVDDEPAILDVVRAYLEREGFAVETAPSGSQALITFARWKPDLVILDLMLPDIAGEEVCKELRRQSDVPILMLTARTGQDEIVEGLALGADDYVTKPFSPRELAARVRAILRRAQGGAAPLVDRMSFGGGALVIDTVRREVTVRGEPVALTRTEMDLLVTLARHPGRVWTREDLIARLRGLDYTGDERTIDAHIRKLRAKIEADPKSPEFILTVWGTGYKFGGTPGAS
ncbi:response regulator transcription factor [Caldinitratiruptor microaerophilus]|uniref:response regulator transcription factor n=1 Tax=Caldinitratiruptor microaerophilus TaxID=671077 RepID=UPI0029F5B269|nr:response regulator transcription factor [Caldinitratiruptor microaerophilus]